VHRALGWAPLARRFCVFRLRWAGGLAAEGAAAGLRMRHLPSAGIGDGGNSVSSDADGLGLGDNPPLVLVRPRTPSTDAGDHLKPADADHPLRFECRIEITHKSISQNCGDRGAPRRLSERAVTAPLTYHQQVAKLLEDRFPEVASTQPELVAHHYTEANCPAPAIAYWHKAGVAEASKSANVEAIDQFNRGLALK
jgi:hypothetical protein